MAETEDDLTAQFRDAEQEWARAAAALPSAADIIGGAAADFGDLHAAYQRVQDLAVKLHRRRRGGPAGS